MTGSCQLLPPASLIDERVEDIQEERHNGCHGSQDKISDVAFVGTLRGEVLCSSAARPPRVPHKPPGSFLFGLQFLPEQRSLRCGNLRQHLGRNTLATHPNHPCSAPYPSHTLHRHCFCAICSPLPTYGSSSSPSSILRDLLGTSKAMR